MYKVIMKSGPVKHDFQGGFEQEVDAFLYAEEYNFRWIDEDGFEWRLEVEEDDETETPAQDKYYSDLCIPRIEWAYNFVKFRQCNGDDSALVYLMDVMENTFGRDARLRFTAIRRLVDAAYALNCVIALMEYDEIATNSTIEESYRNIMQELERIALSVTEEAR